MFTRRNHQPGELRPQSLNLVLRVNGEDPGWCFLAPVRPFDTAGRRQTATATIPHVQGGICGDSTMILFTWSASISTGGHGGFCPTARSARKPNTVTKPTPLRLWPLPLATCLSMWEVIASHHDILDSTTKPPMPSRKHRISPKTITRMSAPISSTRFDWRKCGDAKDVGGTEPLPNSPTRTSSTNLSAVGLDRLVLRALFRLGRNRDSFRRVRSRNGAGSLSCASPGRRLPFGFRAPGAIHRPPAHPVSVWHHPSRAAKLSLSAWLPIKPQSPAPRVKNRHSMGWS